MMEVEASKVRKNFSSYLEMAARGEEIIITKHGKAQGKLMMIKQERRKKRSKRFQEEIDNFCGMWRDKKEDGVTLVNRMRKGRSF